MKKILSLFLVALIYSCSQTPSGEMGFASDTNIATVNLRAAAPASKSNPVDSIILINGKVWEYHKEVSILRGKIIAVDDNGNIYGGLNGTVINGLQNYLGGDNVIIRNGSGNFVQANHGIVDSCHGVNMTGADHKAHKWKHSEGANYANISGDANDVGGYASSTSGGGNINNVEYGIVSGYGNRNGKAGISNQYYGSSIYGYYCVSEGSYNNVQGKFLHVIGNNITVIGSGISQSNPTIITQPGFYSVQNGVVIKLQ